MKWNLDYPKDKDLQWKVKGPGEKNYTLTNTMPYKQDSSKVDHNSSNVNKVAEKYGTGRGSIPGTRPRQGARYS